MKRTLMLISGVLALVCAAAGFFSLAPARQGSQVLAADSISIDPGAYRGQFEACVHLDQPSRSSSCIKDLVHVATVAHDWGAALGILRESVSRVPDMVGRCHNEAHLVGEALYDAGTPLEVLYTIPFSDCRFGFYHGGVTSHTEPMDLDQLITALPSLCAYFGPETAATQECVHVLGHFVFDRTLPDLHRALEVCMVFASETLIARCTDGVLMQATDLVRPGAQDPTAPEHDLLQKVWGPDRQSQETTITGVCGELAASSAPTVAYTCYTNLAQVLAVLWNREYPAIHQVCDSVPEAWHRPCFEGIAASGFTAFDWDIAAITDACHAGDSPSTRFCIRTLSFTFALQGTQEQAESVCALARVEELDACRDGLREGASVRSELSGTVSDS